VRIPSENTQLPKVNELKDRITKIEVELGKIQKGLKELQGLEQSFLIGQSIFKDFKKEVSKKKTSEEKINKYIAEITKQIPMMCNFSSSVFNVWFPSKKITIGSGTGAKEVSFKDAIRKELKEIIYLPIFDEFMELNSGAIDKAFSPFGAKQLELLSQIKHTQEQIYRINHPRVSDEEKIGQTEIAKRSEKIRYEWGIYRNLQNHLRQVEDTANIIQDSKENSEDTKKRIEPIHVAVYLPRSLLKKIKRYESAKLASVHIVQRSRTHVCANVNIKCTPFRIEKSEKTVSKDESIPNSKLEAESEHIDNEEEILVDTEDSERVLGSEVEEDTSLTIKKSASVLGIDQNQLRRLRTYAFTFAKKKWESIEDFQADFDQFSLELSDAELDKQIDNILPLMGIPINAKGGVSQRCQKIKQALLDSLKDLKRPSDAEPYSLNAVRYKPTLADVYMAPIAYWGEKRDHLMNHVKLCQKKKAKLLKDKAKLQLYEITLNPESVSNPSLKSASLKAIEKHIRQLKRQISEYHRKFTRYRDVDIPRYLENLLVHLIMNKNPDIVAIEDLNFNLDRRTGAVGRITSQMIQIADLKSNIEKKLRQKSYSRAYKFKSVRAGGTSSQCIRSRLNGEDPITKLDRRVSVDWAYCRKEEKILDSHAHAAANITLNCYIAVEEDLHEDLGSSGDGPPTDTS